jgi:hypothetical protein
MRICRIKIRRAHRAAELSRGLIFIVEMKRSISLAFSEVRTGFGVNIGILPG